MQTLFLDLFIAGRNSEESFDFTSAMRRSMLGTRGAVATQSPHVDKALDVREFYYPQNPGPVQCCPPMTDYVWGQPLGYGACALPGAASCSAQQRYVEGAGVLRTVSYLLAPAREGACVSLKALSAFATEDQGSLSYAVINTDLRRIFSCL